MRSRASLAPHHPAPLGARVRAPVGRRISDAPGGEGRLADRILYRDGLILVIDKPAGIAVHPGPSGGQNLESGFDALRFGLPQPPALAHRLDRDTSGCLVLGRHPKALRRLGRAVRRRARREDLLGHRRGPASRGRGPDRDRAQKISPRYRLAHVRRSRRTAGGDRLPASSAQPAAAPGSNCGRAPVARTSCASIARRLGCPVVGDRVYGGPASREPLQLYARSIKLPLYPRPAGARDHGSSAAAHARGTGAAGP